MKYQVISEEIRHRIESGFYPLDQPLPDEHSLVEEFSCSRMTVKRALDVLASEGIVFRKRGHGTFIVQSSFQSDYIHVGTNETLGFTSLMKEKQVTSKLISFDMIAPTAEVASYLAISEDTPVYHHIRVRCVDDNPHVIEETYMPTPLIPGITPTVLHNSVYAYMEKELGLKIAGSRRRIRAEQATAQDMEELGLSENEPVLVIEQVAYLNTGIAFEYSFARHRFDKFEITTVNINAK
ncbi:GntR family transcriptional regulator [Terribacillus saccharophilus]|uniref:Transcriptional regulator, GntR family n=1 Tax=Terribacillus saccharophilus TaxID=361277 RepID=A0AAX2EFB6_9BACI|nr:GntR family transcriptional regulator [Terribacillus saccharophilus]MEC0301558.1 GntR family transcriptional regulator [Terribacillus saccharophilus]SEN27293.1 transcriptional regulator, GntR family [Terribacillus saccharophilus]